MTKLTIKEYWEYPSDKTDKEPFMTVAYVPIHDFNEDAVWFVQSSEDIENPYWTPIDEIDIDVDSVESLMEELGITDNDCPYENNYESMIDIIDNRDAYGDK